MKTGFFNHTIDLAAGAVTLDKPLCFSMDTKGEKDREGEAPPKKKRKKDAKKNKDVATTKKVGVLNSKKLSIQSGSNLFCFVKSCIPSSSFERLLHQR